MHGLHEVLLQAWRQDKKAALMVTHDVDEALFLSDRIVMMTNGPEARVGEILKVPFARPRDRGRVMEHPEYYTLRERLIGFLESEGEKKREKIEAPSVAPARAGLSQALRSLWSAASAR